MRLFILLFITFFIHTSFAAKPVAKKPVAPKQKKAEQKSQNLNQPPQVMIQKKPNVIINTEKSRFAVGAIMGTYGAVNAKYWFGKNIAVDFNGEFYEKPFKVVYTDFLWHFPDLLGVKSKFARESILYVGVGGGMGFWSRGRKCGRWECKWNSISTGTGYGIIARGVVGLEWFRPSPYRVSYFGEASASGLTYPSGRTVYDFAIGARYYF